MKNQSFESLSSFFEALRTVDASQVQELCDGYAEQRKQQIRDTADSVCVSGTAYYVSQVGDDANDGRTPDTAWASLRRVTEAELCPGDAVLFRRGDLFRGNIKVKPGVTYAAFGTGEKPRIYGWEKSLADPALWVEEDAVHHIWRMTDPILDVGTLVFDNGAQHSVKLIPSYIDGRFVCRNDESRPFEMAREMVRDLDLYWHFDSDLTTKPSRGQDFPIPHLTPESYGTLYLRCDRGNPGAIFSELEALPRRNMISVGSNENVHIDNLCLKYVGCHAIGAGGKCSVGLHVTNCEIGWVGGCIQHYAGTDPNYPEGGRGTVTRYGNGVEVYGGCNDYLVSDCYIYQVYDAAITHQVTTSGKTFSMENVLYRNNLVEYCVYSIEYFLEMNGGDTESLMKNIEMCGNILRLSGYGWGQQRHNVHTPAHIKGWSYENRAEGLLVHHNLFDRSAYRMLHLVAKEPESCAALWENAYVQDLGGMLGQYGANREAEPAIDLYDEQVEQTVVERYGDRGAIVRILKS